MKPETFSSFVPFAGFYYSQHCNVVDSTESRMFHDPNGNPYQNLADIFYEHVSYRTVYREYAKMYVDCLREMTDLGSIKFEEMTSPREYNFQTDRIFVSLSRNDLAKMLRSVRGRSLNDEVAKRFTSRDGFFSFYPNKVRNWPRISEWDHNHVGAVLSAYLKGKFPEIEDQIAEEIYGDCSVQQFLYDAADYTGRAAADLASIKYRIEEGSLGTSR